MKKKHVSHGKKVAKKAHKMEKEHHKAEKEHHKIEKAHKIEKKVKKIVRKKDKVAKVMHEFKEHKLHSGSKKGPMVHNPKQAIAIALSEARRATHKKPKK